MRIASIVDNDSINSLTGFTLSIYTQSCPHRCPQCFSPQTWSESGGKDVSIEEIKELIIASKCHNVSWLGGDPLAPLNRQEVIECIKWIKENTNKIIYVWTGYSKEEVEQWIDISIIDFLITDKFEVENKNLKILLRGSTNQRIFCNGVQKTDKEILEMLND